MNQSPHILFDCECQSVSCFDRELSQLDAKGVRSITILLAAKYHHDPQSLNTFIRDLPVPVSGGVFPEVIYNGRYYNDAMIVILWFDEARIHTFTGVSDLNAALYQNQQPVFDVTEQMASLVISNAKTRASEAAVDALYYRTGQSTQYAGAGSAYFPGCEWPSIITNDGLVSDAIQITCLPYQQQTQVGHGWSVLSGPHLVTESDQNRVMTLDYQPIRPYFRQLIQQNAGEYVAELSIEQMLKQFPVGIQPYDEDMIVRDILGHDDQSIEFIGDIPEFSNIYILSGQPDSLFNYVKSSADIFRAVANDQPNLSIIFSCVGRRAHMGDRSSQELRYLCNSLGQQNTVIGVTSMGEISSNSTGLARLHSMSLVVSSLWS